jgi:hypothetical protein
MVLDQDCDQLEWVFIYIRRLMIFRYLSTMVICKRCHSVSVVICHRLFSVRLVICRMIIRNMSEMVLSVTCDLQNDYT